MSIRKGKGVLSWPEDKQKRLIEQYEKLRSSGVCNMLDIAHVKLCAGNLEYLELREAARDRGLYKSVLTNFGRLMKKFGIKQ